MLNNFNYTKKDSNDILSERKGRKLISFTNTFCKEIDLLNKLLKDSQLERKKYLFYEIPYPYSVGNELEFRYNNFEQLQYLLKEIINDYVPDEIKERYLKRISVSPIDILIKNLYVKSEVLIEN
jgi:hypothetical protein